MKKLIRILIILIVFTTLGFKVVCRKKIGEKRYNNWLVVKTLKEFKNCSDSTTYIYSEFFENKLRLKGQVINNLKEGEWVDYSNFAYGNSQISIIYKNIYKKDILIKTIQFDSIKKYIVSEFEIINDSIQNETWYYSNGRIQSYGKTLKSLNIGEWVEFDSIGRYKFSGKYLGKEKTDTIKAFDTETGETFLKVVSYSPKIDPWFKIDMITNKIDTLK